MNSGDTKTEAMLNVLGNGGSGDQFRGCCNTKTQSYILDAIDRINNLDPGGGEDFTGATASTAGVHGLVPAPLAGDQDKVLKGDGTWGSVGGGITPVQTTGTSTTDVMSQDATTKMIFPDIANNPHQISIGEGSVSSVDSTAIDGIITSSSNKGVAIGCGDGEQAQIGSTGRALNSVSIGANSQVGKGDMSVCIGANAFSRSTANHGFNVAIGASASAIDKKDSVALGSYAIVTRDGEVNVGTGTNGSGFNSTNYRVIGGVHDGQLAQDAVTVAQVNDTIDAINTALSTNIPHIGASS